MCDLFLFGMDMFGVPYTSISQTLYSLNIYVCDVLLIRGYPIFGTLQNPWYKSLDFYIGNELVGNKIIKEKLTLLCNTLN